jgi:hypothetical protein
MFSLNFEEMHGRCQICELLNHVQTMFSGKMMNKMAYYAVGWVPEMCERWQAEHHLVWTIEERATVATALFNRPLLSNFTENIVCSGPVILHRPDRPFWRSNWKPCFAVLQGVFLYLFPCQDTGERLMAISLIRGATITILKKFERQDFALRIDSLGCSSCVRAEPRDLVEGMSLAFTSQSDLLRWKGMLDDLSAVCPHQCSSKFINEATALREIMEALLTVAAREQKKALARRRGPT